jgi:hypothetical protein
MIALVRTFDVQEARKFVPALNETFKRVRGWIRQTQEISRLIDANGSGSSASTIQRLAADREDLIEKIQREVEKLGELGIEVKSLDGLVDFRAIRDGRQVYLCWRFGEESIDHWHELHTGFGGRRPIESSDRFQPSYVS